jgi:hypothetical protein
MVPPSGAPKWVGRAAARREDDDESAAPEPFAVEAAVQVADGPVVQAA